MKKLDLYTQIVVIKKEINKMIDILDGVVKYIKQKEKTPNKGSILQFLDDEEVKK